MEEEEIIYALCAVGSTMVVLCFVLLTCTLAFTKRRSQKREYHRSTSNPNDIGANKNDWTFPVFEPGPGDSAIRQYFTQNALNFSTSDWEESCSVIDDVMTVLVREMGRKAAVLFPGLVIKNTLIKQGSSREGLKVCDPYEFDYILPFCINGFEFQKTSIRDRYGNIVPGLFKQRVLSPYVSSPRWMETYRLLEYDGNILFLNTMKFTSLFDSSVNDISKKSQLNNYKIYRSVGPPNLKITIAVKKSFGLRGLKSVFVNEGKYLQRDWQDENKLCVEVDLVPAMKFEADNIPDPYTVHTFHQSTDRYPKGWCRKLKRLFFPSEPQDITMLDTRMMLCERYGVMKWVNKKNPDIIEYDKDFLWRESTCGYEKHILDVARRNQSQKYVMTACRLLKGALKKFPSTSIEQLGSVLKSYQLKNICLYCFLFLTIPSKNNKLDNVQEALGYFVKYLEMSIDAGYLPHFFYGNPHISLMLPGSPFEKENTKYNILAGKDTETLRQAGYSLGRFLQTLDGLYYREWMLDKDKIKLFGDLLKTTY